ncbi:MAG: sensor histidine kinase [Halobacteriota archaeon]
MESKMEVRDTDHSKKQLLSLINKTMRHDILNDLTIINNNLEAYKDTKDEKLLDNALNAIERSFELVKDMRELENLVSAENSHSLQPYNLKEVIESVAKRYHLAVNIEGDCVVIADKALTSVMDNIMGNAIKHGRADRIDVTIEIEDESDLCRVKIADNGLGIPQDMKERIFDEGFSSCRNNGLGLYIVRKTIERYGGDVRVDDNWPCGTVIILTLNLF